jgi:hypothetical protein
MNNQVLTDGTVVYYAVLLNGQVISQKFTDRFAAEQARKALPPEQQLLAEVTPVDGSNRQLLLG